MPARPFPFSTGRVSYTNIGMTDCNRIRFASRLGRRSQFSGAGRGRRKGPVCGGFTVMELLVVIAIIASLAALLLKTPALPKSVTC